MTTGIITLQDTASGQCLQLRNGKAINSNIIELGDCDLTNKGQQFYLTDFWKGSKGEYRFASMIDKQFCIDNGNRPEEGDDVIIWTCQNLHQNQNVIVDKKTVVDEILDLEEIRIQLSFKTNRKTFIYTDGNNIKQTLDEQSATAWKVLLHDRGNPVLESREEWNKRQGKEVWETEEILKNYLSTPLFVRNQLSDACLKRKGLLTEVEAFRLKYPQILEDHEEEDICRTGRWFAKGKRGRLRLLGASRRILDKRILLPK